MKVLATRRYPGPAFDELAGVEIGPLEPREDVEVLVVANEPVDPEWFPSLRLVAYFGVGYDRRGVEELGRRGVVVANTPGVLDAATADLTWALILAVRRRVVEGDRRVRAGQWAGSWSVPWTSSTTRPPRGSGTPSTSCAVRVRAARTGTNG